MSQDKDKTLFFRRFSKESRKGLWNFEGSLRIKLFEKWKIRRYRLFLRRGMNRAKYTFLLEGRRLTWYREFDTLLCLQPDLHRVYIYIWCFACTYYSISRFLQTVKTYFARKKKKYEILIYELFTILKLWTNYLWFSLVKISLKVSFEQNEISYPPMQYLFRMKFSFLSSICLRSLKRRSRTFRGKCLYHLRAAWRQRGNDV